jgi:hypothetical protein
MVEADHVFLVDVARAAGLDPIAHLLIPLGSS